MSNFYTLNERLKECHNDMAFLKKNGITVDRVKAERRRRDAAAKAGRRRMDAAAKAVRRRLDVAARSNAAVGLLGAGAVLQDILRNNIRNPTPSEYKAAPAGGRKTRRKRRRKKKKSRRKRKTRRRRKKRKTRKKRR